MLVFLTNVFGSIAFVTSFIGILPQIYKNFKTKSTGDISMLMLINFLICSGAWLGYGLLTKAFYVILSNLFGVLIMGIGIWQKIYYDKKKK